MTNDLGVSLNDFLAGASALTQGYGQAQQWQQQGVFPQQNPWIAGVVQGHPSYGTAQLYQQQQQQQQWAAPPMPPPPSPIMMPAPAPMPPPPSFMASAAAGAVAGFRAGGNLVTGAAQAGFGAVRGGASALMNAYNQFDVFNNFGGAYAGPSGLPPVPGYAPTGIPNPFLRGHTAAVQQSTLMQQMQGLSSVEQAQMLGKGFGAAGAGAVGTFMGAGAGAAIGHAFGNGWMGAEIGATVGGIAGGYGLANWKPYQQVVGAAFGGTIRNMVDTGGVMGMTQNFVRSGSAMDKSGSGLNMQSARSLLGQFDGIAAGSRGSLTRRDVMDMARVASDQGLLDSAQNVESIAKAVKNITKLAKGFAELTGDPDWRNNVRLMGQLNRSGVGADDMMGTLRNVTAFGAMAGKDAKTALADAEYMGRVYQSRGVAAASGLEAGAFGQGVAELVGSSGVLSDRQLNRFGGKEGVANTLGEIGLDFVTSSDYLMPYLAKEGNDGKMGIDSAKLDKLRRGEVSLDEMMREGAANVQGPQQMEKLINSLDDLRDEMSKSLGSTGSLAALAGIIKDVQKQYGVSYQSAATMVTGDKDKARLLTQLMESGKLGGAINDQLAMESERRIFDQQRARRQQVANTSGLNAIATAANDPGILAGATAVGGVAALSSPLAPLVAPAALLYGGYKAGSAIYDQAQEAGTEWYLRQQSQQQAAAMGRNRQFLGIGDGLSSVTGHAADVVTRGMTDEQLIQAMRTKSRGLTRTSSNNYLSQGAGGPDASDFVLSPLDSVRTSLTGRTDEERSYIDSYISAGNYTPGALTGVLGGRTLSGADAFLASPFAGARLLAGQAGASDRYDKAAAEMGRGAEAFGAGLRGEGAATAEASLIDRIYKDITRVRGNMTPAERAAAKRQAAKLAADFRHKVKGSTTVMGMQESLSVSKMGSIYSEVVGSAIGDQAGTAAGDALTLDSAGLRDAFSAVSRQDVTGEVEEGARLAIEQEMGRSSAAQRGRMATAGKSISETMELMEDKSEFLGQGGVDMDSESDVAALRQLFTGDDSAARAVLQIATAKGDWFGTEAGLRRLDALAQRMAREELEKDEAFRKLGPDEQQDRVNARATQIREKATQLYRSADAGTRNTWKSLGRNMNAAEGMGGSHAESMEVIALLREGTTVAVPKQAALAQLSKHGFSVGEGADDRQAGRSIAQQWKGMSAEQRKKRVKEMRASGDGKLASALEGMNTSGELSDEEASQLFLTATGGAATLGQVDTGGEPTYLADEGSGMGEVGRMLQDVTAMQNSAASKLAGGAARFDAAVNKFTRAVDQGSDSETLNKFNAGVPAE